MTREHDIEALVRQLTALGSNPHAYADETIRSRCDEATIALSSLAAENGRLRKALYWLVRSGVGASHEIR